MTWVRECVRARWTVSTLSDSLFEAICRPLVASICIYDLMSISLGFSLFANTVVPQNGNFQKDFGAGSPKKMQSERIGFDLFYFIFLCLRSSRLQFTSLHRHSFDRLSYFSHVSCSLTC